MMKFFQDVFRDAAVWRVLALAFIASGFLSILPIIAMHAARAEEAKPAATPPAAAAAAKAAPPAAKPAALPAVAPAAAETKAAAPTVPLPDANKIVLLVRTTMLSLNDALQTGNFAVLRERGSPNFQTANTVEHLAEIFGGLRKAGIDLSPTTLLVPNLTSAATVDPQNRLRIAGTFSNLPMQVNFEMAFEPFANQWRLLALSVYAIPPQVNAAPTVAPAAAAKPTAAVKPEDPTSKLPTKRK